MLTGVSLETSLLLLSDDVEELTIDELLTTDELLPPEELLFLPLFLLLKELLETTFLLEVFCSDATVSSMLPCSSDVGVFT